MKKTLILLFFFVFIESYQRAAAEQVNIVYGGFSFGSNLPTNTVTHSIKYKHSRHLLPTHFGIQGCDL